MFAGSVCNRPDPQEHDFVGRHTPCPVGEFLGAEHEADASGAGTAKQARDMSSRYGGELVGDDDRGYGLTLAVGDEGDEIADDRGGEGASGGGPWGARGVACEANRWPAPAPRHC